MTNINYEELGFQRVSFDPSNPIKLKYSVKQSDTKSRGFFVQIIQENAVMTPSAGDLLTLFAKKPDGTEVFATATIEGDTYVISLPNQTFSLPGLIETELTLQGPNLERITVKGSTINVISTFSTDAVESTSEYTALAQMLSRFSSIMGEIQDVQLYAKNIGVMVGDLTGLTTTTKASAVMAINELSGRMGTLLNEGSLAALLDPKVDKTTLGVMGELITENKLTIIGAMNELKAGLEKVKTATSSEELIGIFTSKADKSTVGDLSLLQTLSKDSLVNALNEVLNSIANIYAGLTETAVKALIDGKVGLLTNLPTVNKTSIVAAIVEINTALAAIKSVTNTTELTALISGKASKTDLTNLSTLTSSQISTLTASLNALDAAVQSLPVGMTTAQVQALINAIPAGMVEADVQALILNKVDNITLTNALLLKVDNTTLGDTATLLTVEKVIVNAINEIYRALGGTVATGDIATILLDYAKKADLNNVIATMADINADVGNVLMLNTTAKDSLVNALNEVKALAAAGGANQGSISGVTTTGSATTVHNRQVNSSGVSEASGPYSQVNASSGVKAIGYYSQANASIRSEASAQNSQINGSADCKATGMHSQINISMNSIADGQDSQVNASYGTKNSTTYSSAWGYGSVGGTASLTANIKILLESMTGNIKHSGVLTSGHAFTDFAEFFKNLTQLAQEPGLFQTLEGEGVRPANDGEQIIGAISAIAGIILGETPFSWKDRWIKDEWGRYVMEDIEIIDEETGETRTETGPKENPLWNPEETLLTRGERPNEWSVVGLVGQIFGRLYEDVNPGDYVKAGMNGVGAKSETPTNVRVMKITQAYDAVKGYAIGFCLLK